ncbi:hypothetical protein IFM89_034038 [Coptis chinensis]|uniref:SKP1 component POZ domain-containing protein n=1 Tax=Coptis chinensis TaxID=261450 RepID=A0A835ITI9_9MAGN|nr:hypothetical protein IFM89_034038 [Coptis chinensis]
MSEITLMDTDVEDVEKLPTAADESESSPVKKLMEMNKMVTLVSSDGYEYEVEEEVALESQVIKDWIEDKSIDEDDREFLLFNVHSDTLDLIIDYCEKHVSSRKSKCASSSSSNGAEELKEWDDDFIDLDLNTLGSLVKVLSLSLRKCQLVVGAALDLVGVHLPD